jgi:hypothetical protein
MFRFDVMKEFCPTKVRFLPVSRPVNASGDGGGSLISDLEKPRWRSAKGSGEPGRVGMTVGKSFSANAQDDLHPLGGKH